MGFLCPCIAEWHSGPSLRHREIWLLKNQRALGGEVVKVMERPDEHS